MRTTDDIITNRHIRWENVAIKAKLVERKTAKFHLMSIDVITSQGSNNDKMFYQFFQ